MTVVPQKWSQWPQIVPPFTGAEMVPLLDQNGINSWAHLSDLLGVGIRAVANSGVANIPAFAALCNAGVDTMGLATSAGTQAQAQVVAIALGPIAIGNQGSVQFNGYISGLSGLTPGPVWLGVAGGLVNAPPNSPGGYNTLVGYAISTTELILAPGFPQGPN